jgi:hypothetical protein
MIGARCAAAGARRGSARRAGSPVKRGSSENQPRRKVPQKARDHYVEKEIGSKGWRWSRLCGHRGEGRFVITAGHCLPRLPPCCTFSHYEERTYQRLLGLLDVAKPTVWAECLFVDPIADLAVLAAPDSQTLHEENEQYKALAMAMTPLRIARAEKGTSAFILSLDQKWLACHVSVASGSLWITGAKSVGGMSGSPILDGHGRAIGVVCTGSEGSGFDGPHAQLMYSLPRWVPPLR